jgi:hypothetical protein
MVVLCRLVQTSVVLILISRGTLSPGSYFLFFCFDESSVLVLRSCFGFVKLSGMTHFHKEFRVGPSLRQGLVISPLRITK